MHVDFNSLPPQARIWIYQSQSAFSPQQEKIIDDALRLFTGQWTVHGAPMNASFKIDRGHFVILGANDQASGCSIDSSVRVMRELGSTLNVNFLDRNQIAFWIDEKVRMIPLASLKEAYSQKIWNGRTLYFNNLVNSVGELDKSWIVPAEKTWLSRYLLQETVPD